VNLHRVAKKRCKTPHVLTISRPASESEAYSTTVQPATIARASLSKPACCLFFPNLCSFKLLQFNKRAYLYI